MAMTFSFFSRKPEPAFQVLTFRGAANGWQVRTTRNRTEAARFLVLLNRTENTRLHKCVAV